MILPATRKASWEFYADIQSDAMAQSRWPEVEAYLGRMDLFYLLVRLLRRSDANHDWLFERAREIQASPNGHLDLWARGHYKSTWITFALTIQDILRNPEITASVFSHTRPIAKGFLVQVKREFEDNAILKDRYSEVLWANPQKESPRWSEDGGLVVKRKSNPRESTLEAWGLVDGQPTGRHFMLRIYDDIVADRMSPEMVQKTTDAWDLSQNLGVTDGGAVRYIGTRYSLYDTYASMIDRGAVVPRIHTATHNGRMDGAPVFLSEEVWKDKLRDSSSAIIAAQQLQNPMADDSATFQTQWLRSYELRPRTLNCYLVCDPAASRSATSDNTAIAVVGIASTGAKFLLDGFCHRMTLSQRWQALRGLYRRWSATEGVQHIRVGYERFGAQSDMEYFDEQMELDHRKRLAGAYFQIEELNWPREGGNSKRERVQRLEPDFRNGRFFLPLPVLHEGKPKTWHVINDPDAKNFGEITYRDATGLTRNQMAAIEGGSTDLVAKAIVCRDPGLPGPKDMGGRYDLTLKLIDEYRTFPFGRFDDLVDALSRVYDLEPNAPIGPSSRKEIVNVYPDGV